MNLRSFIIYFFIIATWSCGDKKAPENEITIFCAASLVPVMDRMKDKWEKDHREKIIINAASSGILARQIKHGAQADIFLSANQGWIGDVKENVIKNQPKSLPVIQAGMASNRLAVVAPLDAKPDSIPAYTDYADRQRGIGFKEILPNILSQNSKISIGDPGHVPLGKYTKECLHFYSVYDEMSARYIFAKDARSTLVLVELGEAAFGFVYLSDALTSRKVRIISVIPEESHSPIDYQAILIKEEAKEFFEFLSSEATKGIWTDLGFIY